MNRDRPLFRGGFCGNPRCSCAAPSLPCDEYMGIPGEDDGWCPRCGWNNAAHDFANRPAPQPNGDTVPVEDDPAITTLADVTAFAESVDLSPDDSMKPRWSCAGCDVSISDSGYSPAVEVKAAPNTATGHNEWTARYAVGTPRSVIAAAVAAARHDRRVSRDGVA